MSSPVRPTRTIVTNTDPIGYTNRILVGTPTRGTVRIEWHNAMHGLVIPTNWSMVSMCQPMSTFIPVRFQVADAQNMIVHEALQRDFEWVLLLEDDVIPPADLLIKLNMYMQRADTPVVSGLYYTKSEPSEPLIYHGKGNGSFLDFNPGDPVWADGVPTGCLLIHHAILREMSDDAEWYDFNGQRCKRVFESAVRAWVDPETGSINTKTCTSDLDWCWRLKDGDYFARSGWTDYQGREYPFLVDTSILCFHITPDGRAFPGQPPKRTEAQPPDLGVSVSDVSATAESLS
jgi:hypothetical protein